MFCLLAVGCMVGRNAFKQSVPKARTRLRILEIGLCMRELAASLHERTLGRSLHMSNCRAFPAMDTAEFLAHRHKSTALPSIKAGNL